jgi:predicted ATPase
VIFAATFIRSGLSHSLIFIDTPELYLGSDRVAPFVGALRSMGVDNQLIVATGSRELLETVDPQSVIRLGQGAMR